MGCYLSTVVSSMDGETTDSDKRMMLSKLCERSIKLNNGKLVVKGVVHRAGVMNCNGRVYPKHVLEREVVKYLRDKVAAGLSFGELDHPSPCLGSQAFRRVNLTRVSHQLVELHWERDALVGTVEVLDTPHGEVLRRLYLEGHSLGVSSRGFATLGVGESGVIEVGDDFHLITFDYVSEPSTPGAYLFPIDFSYDGHIPNQEDFVQQQSKGAWR
ncbi:prohead core protein protease [Chloropicon primus]|uniref:Prohead core protein protease n=1 Tax=Chloropicon primus TaxID=1764295 RepID=A0A5B8MU65_9CHLO|nr:prohead core protein protease [Chloropicon primus]UPR02419.1 prohead core protein protease [Chloropicon primus]|eukprot:QDZ23205.1 prohead core protein protease [Chloropicon primus]